LDISPAISHIVFQVICYNQRMIEAVILDMDGVMVDTEHIQSKAFEEILEEHGITPEKNEHGTVHISGMTTPETWELLKKRHGFNANTDELTRKKRDVVISVIKNGIEPMPGLIHLLDDLSSHRIHIAVATSAQPERAHLALEMLGVVSYFEAIVTAADIKNGKPAPDPYLKAAQLLGIPAEHCVVIEDAEVGVISAKAANMKVVAVPNEYTKRMNFSQADLIANSLNELNYKILTGLMTD
jgi:beta-phosphoglucomutase